MNSEVSSESGADSLRPWKDPLDNLYNRLEPVAGYRTYARYQDVDHVYRLPVPRTAGAYLCR